MLKAKCNTQLQIYVIMASQLSYDQLLYMKTAVKKNIILLQQKYMNNIFKVCIREILLFAY